jgi:predicted nucleic acid-binding protein
MLGKSGKNGSLLKSLAGHKIVGIDTSPFIYHLEEDPAYSKLTVRLFEEVEKGSLKDVTSVLTLMEVLDRPKQVGDRQAVEDYRFVLKTFPNLALRPIDESCAERASDLRAEYGTRPLDALQVGTALSNHATGFVTNDGKLKRIRELEVLVLDDFADK